MPATNRKLRVFLSYSSQDKLIVRELYQKLLDEGWIDPWLDEEKLLPGMDLDVEIKNAVETADAVIVCLSTNSVSEEGLKQRELKFALDIALEKPVGTVFIIPMRLDSVHIPRQLRPWQYVDYFPNNNNDLLYKRLRTSLKLRASWLTLSKDDQFIVASNWDQKKSLKEFDLSEQNLDNKHFIGCDLTQANLAAASMKDVYLKNAKLVKADLTDTVMKNAVLEGAELQYANLHKANLENARLQGAFFNNAKLEEVNLKDADVSDEQLEKVWCLRKAIMSDGKIYNGKYNLRGDVEIIEANIGVYKYPLLGIHSVKSRKLASSVANWYGVDVKTFLDGQRTSLEKVARKAAFPLIVLIVVLVIVLRFVNNLTLFGFAGAGSSPTMQELSGNNNLSSTPDSNSGETKDNTSVVPNPNLGAQSLDNIENVIFKFNAYDCPTNIIILDENKNEILSIQIPSTNKYTLSLPPGNYEYKVTLDCPPDIAGAAGVSDIPQEFLGKFIVIQGAIVDIPIIAQ